MDTDPCACSSLSRMETGHAGINSGWVNVPRASIYWESSGAEDGIPVLYLHGGPGGSLGNRGYRSLYDPARFRTIGLDQRGCGRSIPNACDVPEDLPFNTTGALIADIEAVRLHLGVEKWIVTGISWGATLALAYALAHPQRVLSVALAAVTATTRAEVQWFTEGAARFTPEDWHVFAGAAQARPHERLVEAYARRLAGADPEDALKAARSWHQWEYAIASMDPSVPPGPRFDGERSLLTFALLVCHYWANDAFLPGEQSIPHRIQELDGIPGVLIHGRRDIGSPIRTAWQLNRRWHSSSLTVIEDEGHTGPKSLAALTAAVHRMGWNTGT